MNNQKQTGLIGAILIGLGVVWWLNLWWMIWPGVLAAAGIAAYYQRRQMGRTVEAVQAGVWLVGMALLFVLSFFWPGILFLAGASILMRGREYEIDNRIQRLIGGVGRSTTHRTTQQVPVMTQTPQQPSENDAATTGNTTRL